MRAKRLAIYAILSLLFGIGAFTLCFASGFGPCGPASPLGLPLIVMGFVAVACGLVALVRAGWHAVFRRS